MGESRSSSRWAYDGEVEQWAENKVERELAKMTGSLEQLGGLEEKEESGSLVNGSENCLREYLSREEYSSKVRGLLNARHKKSILERRYLPAESVQEGVRCVGRSEVCGKD